MFKAKQILKIYFFFTTNYTIIFITNLFLAIKIYTFCFIIYCIHIIEDFYLQTDKKYKHEFNLMHYN